MNDKPRSDGRRDKESQRMIAFGLLLIFSMSTLMSIFEVWKRKQNVEILGIQKPAQAWVTALLFAEGRVEELGAKRRSLRSRDSKSSLDAAVDLVLDEGLQAKYASSLGLVIPPKQLEKAQALYLKRYHRSIPTSSTLSTVLCEAQDRHLLLQYDSAIQAMWLARELRNFIQDTEFLLPFEVDLFSGQAKYQTATLELPETEIALDEPREVEIENAYIRDRDELYRKPNRCQLRTALLNPQSLPSLGVPDLGAVKDYYRENKSEFERTARRCFRYVFLPEGLQAKETLSPLLKKTQMTLAEFEQHSPKLDVRAKGELPVDFARRLFSLKPGEVDDEIRSGNALFAIQYLFEIPAREIPLEEACPLATLKQYERTKETRWRALSEELFAMPQDGSSVKTKLDLFIAKHKLKVTWKVECKEIAVQKLGSIFCTQFPQYSEKDYAHFVSNPGLKLCAGKIPDPRYFLHHVGPNDNQHLLFEVSEFLPGKISSLEEVKEQVSQRVRAEKEALKFNETMETLALEVIRQDQGTPTCAEESDETALITSRFPDFGEEQLASLIPTPLLGQTYYATNVDEVSKLLSCLPIPRSGSVIYGLLKPAGGGKVNSGDWKLIRYDSRLEKVKTDYAEQAQLNQVLLFGQQGYPGYPGIAANALGMARLTENLPVDLTQPLPEVERDRVDKARDKLRQTVLQILRVH